MGNRSSTPSPGRSTSARFELGRLRPSGDFRDRHRGLI
jgi:hypothetical protein